VFERILGCVWFIYMTVVTLMNLKNQIESP